MFLCGNEADMRGIDNQRWGDFGGGGGMGW